MSSVNFLIGKTLGKYNVLEHIGHGGMAEVYKGQHVQLDRMVAVKVLHPFLADEDGFVIRFKREARIVATLRHPNIMQVYDFDYNEDLGIYYMVMEFIDGPTLKTRLRDETIDPEAVARFGAAIADALDYAHDRGMVHRDIKPANIMFITKDQPVLTDFGIAKMLTLSGLTASGAMVGTPAYMAPEVGMGKAGISASDIYSLGVVLYQMVTGELPFQSESPMGMVMQHINDTPKPPSQLSPITPELEAVILRALEKQPEARYSRASEMAVALRQAIGIETPGVTATGTFPPAAPETPLPASLTPKPPSPGPANVAGDDDNDRLLRTWPIASAGLTPATLNKTPLSEAVEVDPEADEEEVPARRSPARRWALAFVLLLVMLVGGGAAWIGFGGEVPAEVLALLPAEAVTRLPQTSAHITVTPTPTVTLTPTSTPVRATPTPSDEPIPPPQTEVTTCNYRLSVTQVRLVPDRVVLPGSTVVAYIALHNTGNCDWPEETRIDFISGEQMQAPDVIPVTSIGPGATMQVLVPLVAPEEPGDYAAEWRVRRADGSPMGDEIIIALDVADDLPTPTPVPPIDIPAEPAAAPLLLSAPILARWEDSVDTATWEATVVFTSTGGTGEYRYYWQEIRAETLLPDGQLSFTGQRCVAFPLQVWVLSGPDVAQWEGRVPYPAPEVCP